MKSISGIATSVLVLGLSAPAAMSLEFGPGFSLTGEIELEYVSRDDGLTNVFTLPDLTLGWRSQAGDGIGFGFDLGVLGNDEHNDTSRYFLNWGALVLTTQFGELSVGRPRAILDTWAPAPTPGAVDAYADLYRSLVGSYLTLIQVNSPEMDTTSVTFKGSSGQFSYGIGFHHLTYYGASGNVIELAASYSTGPVLVYAGYEQLPNDTVMAPEKRFTFGASYDADRWGVGAKVVRSDFSPTYGQTSFLAYGSVKVTDSLSLGIQYLETGEDWADPFYGVSGKYSFLHGAYAEVGYLEDGYSGKSLWTASLGFDF